MHMPWGRLRGGRVRGCGPQPGRPAATTAVHFDHQTGPGWERQNAGVASGADLHSAGIPAPGLLPAGAAIARIRHCDWRSEGADDRFTGTAPQSGRSPN